MNQGACRNLLYYLALGTLFTHELDAMTNHEWRVLPLVRLLPDAWGMFLFVILHIPLFALIMMLSASDNEQIRRCTRTLVCGFLILHAGLHALFSGDAAYEFSTWLSNFLIIGGAVFAVMYLAFPWVFRPRKILEE